MKKYKIRFSICTLIIIIMYSTLFIYSLIGAYNDKMYICDVEAGASYEVISYFIRYLLNFWYIFYPISLIALLIMINSLDNLKKIKKENSNEQKNS